MKTITVRCCAVALFSLAAVRGSLASSPTPVVSLDGITEWRVAFDAQNVGRQEKWWQHARPEARPIRVPGTIQEVLPGCHGVAWYWRDVTLPVHPQADGRYLLRFWMVNSLADE